MGPSTLFPSALFYLIMLRSRCTRLAIEEKGITQVGRAYHVVVKGPLHEPRKKRVRQGC